MSPGLGESKGAQLAQILKKIQGHRENISRLFESFQKGRLAPTLLFAGPSGVGKKLVAQALVQALVCEKPSQAGQELACGECGPCLRVEKGQSESLKTVEPDGATIKIEQAREILQFVTLQKLGRARAIVIEQAHLLNPQAANALLKALEEPPSGTYFILITPIASAILATIRSRAQLIRFSPLTSTDLRNILGANVDDWAIESANGSVEVARRLIESRDEFGELEEATGDFLRATMERFPGAEVSRLKDMTKDRSAQSFAMNLLQNAILNALKRQSGLKLRRSNDSWNQIEQRISGIESSRLALLAESSLMLESEMARNIDRGLLLENFALELRRGLS